MRASPRSSLPLGVVTLALVACAAVSHEQDAPAQRDAAAPPPSAWSSAGAFAPGRLAAHRDLERALLAVPRVESLRASHDLLASRPHAAGTPGGLAGAERLASIFRAMPGVSVATPEYSVLLPVPRLAELEMISPERRTLSVHERRLPDADPFTAQTDTEGHDTALGWNGYSGSGEAIGEVVYANYGTKADFEKLTEQGVSCAGKIVLARYGGNFRGYKAKFAQEAGAAGLLIFTDPGDSGYAQGPVYPEGPWGNDTYIQRGSIDTLPYDGDPLTPGVAATPQAQRLDPATIALPRIPVQPIGYATALEIMAEMVGPPVHVGTGASSPPGKAWQGGLPLTYRVSGGSNLKVRLKIDQPREQRPIRNVVATIKGERFPEQVVIVGAHHDAWVFGADDPLSGTIVVAELARAFADAAAKGFRPARTILFCGWDAEELGIIGSSEWVEEHAKSLGSSCVAYINLDAAVSGWDFSASASPSLQRLIWEAAAEVPQPADPRPGAARPTTTLTLLDAWRARQQARAATGATPQRRADQPPETRQDDLPSIGTLGGGSDHTGFLTHLCIPSASMGFGGAGGTAYHSLYDTLAWYRLMMHDDYSPHLALTRVVGLVLARLANADAIPYDHAAPAQETRRHLNALADRAQKKSFAFDAAPIAGALDRADRAAALAVGAIAGAAARAPDASACAGLNALQIATERAWFDEAGLPERPWRRNLFIAPDETSGYASWPLPGVRRAVERADSAELSREAPRLEAAVDRLERALSALAGAAPAPATP